MTLLYQSLTHSLTGSLMQPRAFSWSSLITSRSSSQLDLNKAAEGNVCVMCPWSSLHMHGGGLNRTWDCSSVLQSQGWYKSTWPQSPQTHYLNHVLLMLVAHKDILYGQTIQVQFPGQGCFRPIPYLHKVAAACSKVTIATRARLVNGHTLPDEGKSDTCIWQTLPHRQKSMAYVTLNAACMRQMSSSTLDLCT